LQTIPWTRLIEQAQQHSPAVVEDLMQAKQILNTMICLFIVRFAAGAAVESRRIMMYLKKKTS
jgi:hypothetical protein